jgi:hypothetical protein
MCLQFNGKIALAILSILFPLNFASAEKIQVDDKYYEKTLLGKCIFGFSKSANQRVKISFETKGKARYLTESYQDREMDISLSVGNMAINWGSGGATYSLITENNQSFMRDVKKDLNRSSDRVYYGDCATKWDNYESLDPLPIGVIPSSSSVSTPQKLPIITEKDEIAALEKKLAALKQKAVRKEEYLKMRNLLQQKIDEVQGQIRMLEQEYKDVLN